MRMRQGRRTSCSTSTGRISGSLSSPATKCISDVPGLEKHTVTSLATSVRISVRAPDAGSV